MNVCLMIVIEVGATSSKNSKKIGHAQTEYIRNEVVIDT